MKRYYFGIILITTALLYSTTIFGQVNNIYIDDFTYLDGSRDHITRNLTRNFETIMSNNLPSGHKLLMRRSIAKLEWHRQNEEELTYGNEKRDYEKANLVIFGSVKPIADTLGIIELYSLKTELVNIKSSEIVTSDIISIEKHHIESESDLRQILKTSINVLFNQNEKNRIVFNDSSFNIMILPFENLDDCLIREMCLEKAIINRFYELKETDNLSIEAKFFSEYEKPHSYAQARKVGQAYNANIVIWGDYVESCNDTSSACLKFTIIGDTNPVIQGSGEEREKFMNAFDIKNGRLQKQTDYVIFWAIARSKYENKDYAGALKYYRKINTNGELIREIETMKGYCLLNLNRTKEAHAIFDQIKSISDNATDYYKSGRLHLSDLDYHSAIIEFNNAVKIDKNLAVAYLYRGDAHYKNGDLEKALIDYNSAYTIKPYLAILEQYDKKVSIFTECKFIGSVFGGSALMREVYRGTFDSCTFNNSNFSFANLIGCSFLDGNNFENTILDYCVYDKSTKWPTNIDPLKRGAIPVDSVINASLKRSKFLYKDSIIYFEEIREIFYVLSIHFLNENMPNKASMYISKGRKIPESFDVIERNISEEDFIYLEIAALQQLGFQKFHENSPDSAIMYLSKIISMRKSYPNIVDSYILFNATGILGHCYNKLLDLDSASYYYSIAIDEFGKLSSFMKNDFIYKGVIEQFLPIIRLEYKRKNFQGLNDLLSTILKAMETYIDESETNTESLTEDGKTFYENLIETYANLNFNLGVVKMHIAISMSDKKKHIKSIFHIDEALKFLLKSKLQESHEEICKCLYMKALNFIQLNNYSSAINVILENIQYSIENNTNSCCCDSINLTDGIDNKFIDGDASKIIREYRGKNCN